MVLPMWWRWLEGRPHGAQGSWGDVHIRCEQVLEVSNDEPDPLQWWRSGSTASSDSSGESPVSFRKLDSSRLIDFRGLLHQ